VASAFGYKINAGGHGAIFPLSGKAMRDHRQSFGIWEVELRKDSSHVAVRSDIGDLQRPLDAVIEDSHRIVQRLLDIIAVEERNPLVVTEPYNNVVWRTGPHGLKLQLTSGIVFAAEPMFLKGITTDAAGNVQPDPPYTPPQHHYAYRYFRFSQVAQNVFDAYRNMFLALEALLDYVEPKLSNEGETDWLKRALLKAQSRGLNLSAFAKQSSMTPVGDFLDAHYSAVRCAAFHSKSSSGHVLLPGGLSDDSAVLQQLLAVQELVETLLKSEFSTRLMSSGFFPSGFEELLSNLAPVTGLFCSEAECPTLEQVIAEEKNLSQVNFSRVTFTGRMKEGIDEWLFVSEIKPFELAFSKLASLRLVARPNTDLLLGPIAAKMNRTLMTTDLDLTDVFKLILRIRCILRNVQGPKLGFSH
jgi:hypothetical protein